MKNVDYIIIISLCIIHLSTFCEGRALRKRTVSEVQLMHDLGEYRQVHERRDWLQMRLRGIQTAAARGGGASDPSTPRRRTLRADDLPDLSPEELKSALNFVEKLLKSKQW